MKKANGRPQVIAGGIPNPGGRHLLVIRALRGVEIGKVNEKRGAGDSSIIMFFGH